MSAAKAVTDLITHLMLISHSAPDPQVNYAFYDPELHWCKACNVFPKTAKDYLNHLHTKEHTEMVKKNTESPWHENNPNVVSK